MGTEKTAWHPPFTGLLQEFGPGWTRVSGEVRLAVEPRADDLIEVLVDAARDPNDRGGVLRGMWPLIAWVGLLEFKSLSRPFRRGDLHRLFGYGHIWLSSHAHGKGLQVGAEKWRAAGVRDLTLFLVVSVKTPALEAKVSDLSMRLVELAPGYHEVSDAVRALVRARAPEAAPAPG